MRGEPRLNLNGLLGLTRSTAIDDISKHIGDAYPDFETRRKGGFPEDYLKTLAANMMDYADEDSNSSQEDEIYRGIENAPLVSEFLIRYTWEDILTENDRKYVVLVGELYLEMWNPTNIPVHGSTRSHWE